MTPADLSQRFAALASAFKAKGLSLDEFEAAARDVAALFAPPAPVELSDAAAADFAALVQLWPKDKIGDASNARRAFAGLSSDERRDALRYAPDVIAEKRGSPAALATYLRQRQFAPWACGDKKRPAKPWFVVKGSDEWRAWENLWRAQGNTRPMAAVRTTLAGRPVEGVYRPSRFPARAADASDATI